MADTPLVVDALSETDGPFRQSAPVWAGTTPPDPPYRVADGARTDTAELLAAIGMTGAEIDRLVAEGAVA